MKRKQLVRMLIERAQFVSFIGSDSVSIPSSIQRNIGTRILPPNKKQLKKLLTKIM